MRSIARTVSLLCFGALVTGSASAAPKKSAPLRWIADAHSGRSAFSLPSPTRAFAVGKSVPLTLTFQSAVTNADIDAIEARGGRVIRTSRMRATRYLSVEVDPKAIDAFDDVANLERIDLDGSFFRSPRPADPTASTVSAVETWGRRDKSDRALTGQGITICDIDSGIDPFHPLFFRADGGGFDWIDVDNDGRFTPSVDAVDLGTGAKTVEFMNGVVANYWDATPRWETEDEAYDPSFDYLYVDENGNGKRDAGKSKGFTEDSPTYGERLLVPDDANENGKLDVGERLIALKTSKIKVFNHGGRKYERGQDLIAAKWDLTMDHGVGAASVLAGGQLGFSPLVGMAPDAELIMATDTDGTRQKQMLDFCVDQGARVVLHEYAPWVGFHLDG
jgi:subtilisin family serine protease